MKILFIGDLVGSGARRALRAQLPRLQQVHAIDCTVVNIENAAAGAGITAKVLGELADLNIDAMTSGNHIWDKKEALELITREPRLLRPHNYPFPVPGSGWFEAECGGARVGVLNLMGQAFMHPVLDSPFACLDRVLEELGEKRPAVILVDFHAETTAEKMCMGWYADGRVSGVFGTHTHVPTADARILPGGTAYMTDVGMTGSFDSVIGSEVAGALRRSVHKLPSLHKPVLEAVTVCGVVCEVDPQSGRALSIEPLQVPDEPAARVA